MEDMAGRNGERQDDIHDAATRIGILSQRTANLESAVQSINHSIGAMSSKVDERFNALSATMAERSRPQWQALSVMLGALTIMGGLVYYPLREQTNDLKATMVIISDKMVTRDELNTRAERGKEDRERTLAAIIDLRGNTVTRNEWSERNGSRDLQLANIQREIDELKKVSNDTYNVRDVIIDLKSQYERLSNQLREQREEGRIRSRLPS